MEDHRRLVGIPEQDLVGDIEDDRQGNDASQDNGNLGADAEQLELLRERVARHFV